MEVAMLAVFAAVVKKLIDTVRMASNRDYKGVLTQVGAWITGVLAVWTAAQTDAVIAGVDLSKAGMLVIILLGIAVASVGSTVHDGFVAVDNHGASVDVAPYPTPEPPADPTPVAARRY